MIGRVGAGRLLHDVHVLGLSGDDVRSLARLFADAAIVVRAVPEHGALTVPAADNAIFRASDVAEVVADWVSRSRLRLAPVVHGGALLQFR